MYNNYEERIELLNKQLVSEYKRAEESQARIDKTIEILEHIYMLDNVTITNNACEEIDKAIKILKGESNE